MSLKTHHFEFDDFILDLDEKVLMLSGRPLSLTPKSFLLLRTLIEKRGHIVEKDELMSAVWSDSFVEQGNLSFTINQLRKTLGDDSHKPRFIETVPRRGYRFIADVSEVHSNNGIVTNDTAAAKVKTVMPRAVSNTLVVAALVVLVVVVGFGSWYATRKTPSISILNAPFNSERLSTDGEVYHAVISPDGARVIYVRGREDENQGVWLRQLDSATNIEIIPPSNDFYYGFAFAADGNSFYFVRRSRTEGSPADVYRLSVFGGVPVKVIGDTQGWISISPDGGKLSFVRCPGLKEESCSLWIADAADGKNERKLASRPAPLRIGDNKISPDGKAIVFAAGQSKSGANDFGLSVIDIETGNERELTAEKFFNIKTLVWLPDQSGLLITASRVPNRSFRIWQIAAASGEAKPLTNDSETYADLSLDKLGEMLVATRVEEDFRLNLYRTTAPPPMPSVLANAASVTFAPDGKIFFASAMSGNREIWSVNEDGSGQKQLTNDPADDVSPIVSPDNKSIFFSSNRSGKQHIWRINADGSNPKKITTTEGGTPLRVSPDGRSLYYHSALQRTLWHVSSDSGDERQVLSKANLNFAVSPDAASVAFTDSQDGERVLRIVSLVDAKAATHFKMAKANVTEIAWSQTGKFVAYGLADNEFKNNSLWFQFLDQAAPTYIADLGDDGIMEESSMALSPDGETFAVIKGGWRHDAVLIRGFN